MKNHPQATQTMTPIKSIPFADKGPHYVESGARPEMLDIADAVEINVQLENGDIRVAVYLKHRDQFAINPIGDIALNPAKVICWWHLPDPAPATEREWFEAQFKPESPEILIAALKGKGYLIVFLPADDISAKDLYIVGKDDYKAQFDTQEAAIEAAYTHWVAAGRP